jgi:hypothetical protein
MEDDVLILGHLDIKDLSEGPIVDGPLQQLSEDDRFSSSPFAGARAWVWAPA